MTYRKKLIEVALPLEAVNRASRTEKYNPFLKDHPRALHHWWARRPLAACRAVLFASLVDDPSSRPDQFPTEGAQEKERQRLFRLIEELVKWENTNNEAVLNAARAEILKSTDGNPPPVLDPFCGGGSIPLEAQRLGLKAYASDLNPVAVLITKALIEIPPRFAGQPPVNPKYRGQAAEARNIQDGTWQGARGLAEDVRYYGQWIRDEAERRIGHLYPKVNLPKEQGGGEATVIAWLWARTVKCPNPACGATMPLVRSFELSKKKGNRAWAEPVIGANKTVTFTVRTGTGVAPEGTVDRRGARCIVCGQSVPFDHIRAEGKAGRMDAQLMAIVAEGKRGRLYLSPTNEHVATARKAQPAWSPDTNLPEQALGFRVQLYGMTKHRDLFTSRQLVALTTFSDLVGEAREKARQDAIAAGLPDDRFSLDAIGKGATAHGDAVATYLALSLSQFLRYSSTICVWNTTNQNVVQSFARQAIPMTWDVAETNPLIGQMAFQTAVSWVVQALAHLGTSSRPGFTDQLDAAQSLMDAECSPIIVTDPPYYDNIGYADLADFFYVWLRRPLASVFPNLFSTVLSPKAQELVATPYRFEGDTDEAKQFFEDGLSRSFALLQAHASRDYPIAVYYAFKQSEEETDEQNPIVVASTGWESILEALMSAGLQITATWPVHTERPTGVKVAVNALASSIVLVCRPRAGSAPLATRREFTAALRHELPAALSDLQQGNIAPVDFAQAAIGPGMAIFSRYAKVLEADGSAMRVRTALQLINEELDLYLAEQEGDFDGDTRFCIAWFEQRGLQEGPFGEADVLARAKNTAVDGLVRAGVLEARAGKVRLLRRDEYPDDWNPVHDSRLTVWECAQHLIRALEQGGEDAAARLAQRLGGGRSEEARALAYRLYAICERKGWSQEALAYNALVAAWGDVQAKTTGLPASYEQGQLL